MADAGAGDLDKSYGICTRGQRKQSEIDAEKVAWHDLDATTAAALDSIRATAEQNPLLQKLLTNITLLWIVTEDGTIRFCIEQSYEITSPSRRFARPRETDDNSRLLPLGHPMLTDDDTARIAGELYLEQSGPNMIWVLSNKSARYGVGRSTEQLSNVVNRFATFDVLVDMYFLE
jgi:hypothetical protein